MAASCSLVSAQWQARSTAPGRSMDLVLNNSVGVTASSISVLARPNWACQKAEGPLATHEVVGPGQLSCKTPRPRILLA